MINRRIGTKFIDLTGKKFGTLIAVEVSHKNKWGDLYWLCKCECGENKKILSKHLRSKAINNCGCSRNLKTKCEKNRNEAINYSEYTIWSSMKQRCLNKNNQAFKYYGARGITVCDRWKNSFKMFLEDMGNRPKGLSIDRINNNGNYCKENCRWATAKQQGTNTRRTRLFTYNGDTLCLSDWAKKLKVRRQYLAKALNKVTEV